MFWQILFSILSGAVFYEGLRLVIFLMNQPNDVAILAAGILLMLLIYSLTRVFIRIWCSK